MKKDIFYTKCDVTICMPSNVAPAIRAKNNFITILSQFSEEMNLFDIQNSSRYIKSTIRCYYAIRYPSRIEQKHIRNFVHAYMPLMYQTLIYTSGDQVKTAQHIAQTTTTATLIEILGKNATQC